MINFKALKKPFIIAEIGINHEGNFNIAKKLILRQKKLVQMGKIPNFKPFTLAIKCPKKVICKEKFSKKKKICKFGKR